MVHGLALPQDTRPWCLRRDRDQCCATFSSNGAVAAITAGAGTQYSPIGAALLTRMAPALCTRPLAPRSRLTLARMYTSSGAGAGMKYPSTGAGAQNTADAGAMYSSIGAGAEITADAGAVYLSTDAAPRCARPLA